VFAALLDDLAPVPTPAGRRRLVIAAVKAFWMTFTA
jgi:hypothetical protein